MLIALDIAILPAAPSRQRAIELSAALPEKESLGLRLGDDILPHITLTQQFVQAGDLDAALDRVGSALAGFETLPLRVTGPARGQSSVWMAIEPTPALIELHRRLMDELSPFERPDGTAAAFVDGERAYRRRGVGCGLPSHVEPRDVQAAHHVGACRATLPAVEPLAFDATSGRGVPPGEVLRVPARAEDSGRLKRANPGPKPVARGPKPVLASPMARRHAVRCVPAGLSRPAGDSCADAGRVPPVVSRSRPPSDAGRGDVYRAFPPVRSNCE